MINVNKFFTIAFLATITSTLIIKAEDAAQTDVENAQETFELKQYFNQAKEFVKSIDLQEIKEDLSSAGQSVEQSARSFFTAHPILNVVTGMFLAGRALTNYQKANNAYKYFDKEGMQQSKEAFMRSCKKAGRRNGVAAVFFVGGDLCYNHMRKEAIVKSNPNLAQNNQSTQLVEEEAWRK